jgi:TusA-related sulfurtransferase
MREGAAFTVIADDPIARTDIPALAKATGWQCNIVETAGEMRFILHRDAAIGCPIS